MGKTKIAKIKTSLSSQLKDYIVVLTRAHALYKESDSLEVLKQIEKLYNICMDRYELNILENEELQRIKVYLYSLKNGDDIVILENGEELINYLVA